MNNVFFFFLNKVIRKEILSDSCLNCLSKLFIRNTFSHSFPPHENFCFRWELSHFWETLPFCVICLGNIRYFTIKIQVEQLHNFLLSSFDVISTVLPFRLSILKNSFSSYDGYCLASVIIR